VCEQGRFRLKERVYQPYGLEQVLLQWVVSASELSQASAQRHGGGVRAKIVNVVPQSTLLTDKLRMHGLLRNCGSVPPR
jgi:hypothetical protein